MEYVLASSIPQSNPIQPAKLCEWVTQKLEQLIRNGELRLGAKVHSEPSINGRVRYRRAGGT